MLCCFSAFESYSEKGEKVGEASKVLVEKLAAMQAEDDDASCGFAEEGQDGNETQDPVAADKKGVETA
jgi:hypothetical protein